MVRTTRSLNSSLDALAAVEPGFARVLEHHGRPEPRKSEPGVETLLRTIVGQQVSVAAARSMWAKLVARFGEPVDLAALLAALAIDALSARAAVVGVTIHVHGPPEAVAGEPTEWVLRLDGVRRPVVLSPAVEPRSPRVLIDGKRYTSAWGPNKKTAEQKAAMLALEELGVLNGKRTDDDDDYAGVAVEDDGDA